MVITNLRSKSKNVALLAYQLKVASMYRYQSRQLFFAFIYLFVVSPAIAQQRFVELGNFQLEGRLFRSVGWATGRLGV